MKSRYNFLITTAMAVISTASGAFALSPEWVSGTPELGEYSYDRSAGFWTNDPLNNPKGRTDALTWTGLDGSLWMTGGKQNVSPRPETQREPEGYYGRDMWRYVPATSTWTQFSPKGGPNTNLSLATWTETDGSLWLMDYVHLWRYDANFSSWGLEYVYSTDISTGTMGTASSTFSPGTRSNAVTWVDSNNVIYIFGGGQLPDGPTTDMWKFDTSDRTWAWINGEIGASPDYVLGTKGVPAPANHPEAFNFFESSRMNWVDSLNNLWLYRENRMWKFDVTVNQWIWMHGSPTDFQLTIYGTKGVPGAANTPGSRRESVTWTGNDNSFYLFGGMQTADNIEESDLWKYDIPSNTWTWVSGPANTSAVNSYVAVGVPDPSNQPAARNKAISWKNTGGKFYMFSGNNSTRNYYSLDDLWSYNPATDMWTYLKGANSNPAFPVYGTEGISSPTTTPGGKTKATTWVDKLGNFWLFGGSDSSVKDGAYPVAGLWKYDPNIRDWTFKGHQAINPVYGTLKTESPASHPGGRFGATSWTDGDGLLWMFGGNGFASDGLGYLNDLWRFNPETEQWAWMGGSKNKNSLDITNNPSSGNAPSSRKGAASWQTADGSVWLFGGLRQTIKGSVPYFYDYYNFDYLNDLWRFDPQLQQWQLVQPVSASLRKDEGSTYNSYYGTPGTYGTRGVASAANRPGSREGTVAWTDLSGNLWMFGGDGYARNPGGSQDDRGLMNDLWKYTPGTGQWTWMGGLDTEFGGAVFTAPGQFSPYNLPSNRAWSIGWTNGNKLSLCSGRSYLDTYNAIWTYDVDTNAWAWEPFSDPLSTFATYAVKGVAATENSPGYRFGSMVFPAKDGTLWMYGGEGYTQWGYGYLDDMWVIDTWTPTTPPPASNGPDIAGAWAPADAKCKTNGKGITKCKIKATLMVANNGNQDADKSYVRYFLSPDPSLDATDIELKGKKVGKLKPGKGKSMKVNLKLTEPATGKYLISILDAGNLVPEIDETNNQIVSPPLP